uniref:Outer dense fiber protein 3 n=2 Tax=Clastoptera arizonana TaxID=38151 RepID=A0A1B6DAU3_9HEMI
MSDKKEHDSDKLPMSSYHQTPGPNAYVLPTTVGFKEHDTSRWRNPAYSMGTRPKPIDKTLGPGPKYEVRDLLRYGKASTPKYTIGQKLPSKAAYALPGPGTYAPEKCKVVKGKQPPEYSFGVKSYLSSKGFGPGPNAYNLPGCVGMKNPAIKNNPAFSIGNRLGKKIFSTITWASCLSTS